MSASLAQTDTPTSSATLRLTLLQQAVSASARFTQEWSLGPELDGPRAAAFAGAQRAAVIAVLLLGHLRRANPELANQAAAEIEELLEENPSELAEFALAQARACGTPNGTGEHTAPASAQQGGPA